MRPCQSILVLEAVRTRFSRPLHRKGIVLSHDDSQTVIDVYLQWLLLMMDLGYLHPDTLRRDALRLLTDMVKADVLTLNNAFAELLNHVRVQDNKGFKALCACISTHLYPLIKDDIVLMLQGDVYAAKRLTQVFAYTSRLTLHDIDLTQQCLDDYVATENRIDDSFYSSSLISSLNNIIKTWLKAFDPDRIKPRHAKRGVAGLGRTSMEYKYKDLTYDSMLTYAFGDPYWCTSPIRSTLDRISHTVFVPKSYKTFRTISMEPTTLMYFQQGVWKEIDRCIRADRRIRIHMDIHNQSVNRELAREGSLTRSLATIDLSAASDSVSYELVKKLFRGTKLLRYLVTLRSSRTRLPDGRLVALKKFAPMGSALCFPVETIIFGAICRYVTREHGVPADYSVYGDDIIIPTQCVDDVILTLETLGFIVNRDKSFYRSDCWFRESCGGEFVDGFDITPMRVSRKYNHKDRDERLKQLVDLSNQSYTRGFRNLRAFFLKQLRDSGYKPLFGPTSILGDNFTNWHLEKRWNHNLHRIECKATELSTRNGWTSVEKKFEWVRPDGSTQKCRTILRFPPDDSDETIRYRHWLESTSDRTAIGDGFVSITTKASVSIKNRWMLKEFEVQDQDFLDEHVPRG